MKQGRAFIAALLLFGFGCGGKSTDPPVDPGNPGERPDTLNLIVPGFPAIVSPPDNPLTKQGIELGRRLFYDKRLSINQTQSCGTCHDPSYGFSDNGRRFSLGAEGQVGDRNTPALINLAWSSDLFWNGRVDDLEAQAMKPVENPIEMMEQWSHVVQKLEADGDYPRQFRRAFGSDGITPLRAVQAIAQFERTLLTYNSKYDRVLRGQAAFTPSEDRGYALFFTERAECFHCHVDYTFTDYAFHDIGLENPPPQARAEVTGVASDVGAWKTPTLRNLVFTAPYMHDGRFSTLRDVMNHYMSGGKGSPNQSIFVKFPNGLDLTLQEQTDLLNFVLSLTDSSFVTNPAFQDPSGAPRP